MQARRSQIATVFAFAMVFFAALASATDAPPPESTTKVKRVLLYNKVGGWVCTDCIQETKNVFTALAKSKGFELDSLSNEISLTPEYLKQFQIIIWNNNTNGQASVNSASAREAVANYVHQGGGWLLIRYAGDHLDTWPQLREMLGTKFTTHRSMGNADLVPDSSAKKHPELKYVLSAIPQTIRLYDLWYNFENSVRPLEGTTVLFTAANGDSGVLGATADGSGDRPIIWARTIGQGKLLYSSSGHGQANVTAQADSAIPKLYWQSLRWLAGDFQNGCTDRQSPRYDSLARIDDGSCAASSARQNHRHMSKSTQIMARAGQKITLDFPHEGSMQIVLRDLRGTVVFRRIVTAGTPDFQLDASLKAGIYQLESVSGSKSARYSLVVR